MNTIDRLKAMQDAKNDPACSVDEFCERVKAFADAMHNATPALLKVAEAAKASCQMHHANGTHAGNCDVCAALAELEAQ